MKRVNVPDIVEDLINDGGTDGECASGGWLNKKDDQEKLIFSL